MPHCKLCGEWMGPRGSIPGEPVTPPPSPPQDIVGEVVEDPSAVVVEDPETETAAEEAPEDSVGTEEVEVEEQSDPEPPTVAKPPRRSAPKSSKIAGMKKAR